MVSDLLNGVKRTDDERDDGEIGSTRTSFNARAIDLSKVSAPKATPVISISKSLALNISH